MRKNTDVVAMSRAGRSRGDALGVIMGKEFSNGVSQ
jgi:hypothetical protein